MKKLTVLYDASCGLCVRCRRWLAAQPAYLELDLIPQGSPLIAQRFPGLQVSGDELVAVSDEG